MWIVAFKHDEGIEEMYSCFCSLAGISIGVVLYGMPNSSRAMDTFAPLAVAVLYKVMLGDDAIVPSCRASCLLELGCLENEGRV